MRLYYTLVYDLFLQLNDMLWKSTSAVIELCEEGHLTGAMIFGMCGEPALAAM